MGEVDFRWVLDIDVDIGVTRPTCWQCAWWWALVGMALVALASLNHEDPLNST